MRLAFILFAFLAVTLSTGCSKKQVVKATADCSSWTVYRTSKVRDRTESTPYISDERWGDGGEYRACLLGTEYEEGIERLTAEAQYLHEEAKADRLADVTQWGKKYTNRNGESTCEQYTRYANWQVEQDEFFESEGLRAVLKDCLSKAQAE